jgi:hypothetical protein
MKTFYYLDAPAGSGKTYSLSHFAVEQANAGRKIVIAQPSKELIKQTRKAIRDIDSAITVTPIHSGRGVSNVVSAVTAHLTSAPPLKGEVLLITHESLRRLDCMGFRGAWQLVVDEVPAVFVHDELKVRYTHSIVTPHLALKSLGQGISAIEADTTSSVNELLAKAKDDQNIDSFSNLLKSVIDPNRLVCVSDATWDELLAGSAGQLDTFSIQQPEAYDGWSDVTFLGANSEQSELMTIWPRLFDVEFKPHASLGKSLRYTQHQNGSRLTLHYMFDTWSQKFAKAIDGGKSGDAVILKVADAVEALFDGSDFLWGANKAEEDLFSRFSFLPHVPHGLNNPAFERCHNVALLSALNRKTPAVGFLKQLGLSAEEVTATMTHQNAYQAAMRCSLRDPTAIAPVNIVVPSKETAEWIAARFPGSRVQHLDVGLEGPKAAGRPRGPNSPGTLEEKRAYDAAKQRSYRDRQRTKRQAQAK